MTRRSPLGRIAHAVGWRAKRLRERVPAFLPVVREIHAATGRSSVSVAGDLLAAWRQLGFAPYVYAAFMLWDVPAERRSDFVASTELDAFLRATLDPEDDALSNDKVAFAEHDRALALPWLPTLAVISRHEGVHPAGAIALNELTQVWPAIETLARERGDLILKPAADKQGKGLFHVAAGGKARDADGREVSGEALAETVFKYRHPIGAFGYLVQPALAPHPDIVALTGVDALASVRVVVAVSEGRTHILQAFLKIPAPGRLTDNFRRGVSGTFVAAVDPLTGRLGELVGMVTPGNRFVTERVATHPSTGRRIAGSELPQWKALFALAEHAGALHPRTTALGWDIALSDQLGEKAWTILDGNPLWGPAGGQACTRTGLRPALKQVFPSHW